MTDQSAYPPPPVPTTSGFDAAPRERVGLGLLASLLAVVAGVVVTVVLWKAGYIAALSGLVVGLGAAFLYEKAAGTAPRRGIVPLILVIVVGIVACALAMVVTDLVDVYDELSAGAFTLGQSRTSFVLDNVVNPEVLGAYGRDFALFGVFAVLGVFGTVRSLFQR